VTRGGRTKTNEEPERRCISTGEVLAKSDLIRFVVGPENRIVPDIAGKLPGRGIWVTANQGALEKAVQKKLFSRGAKQAVEIPDTLVADVEALLVRHIVSLLSLARKGGHAITGFEKVLDGVVKGSVAVLLQASDGSTGQKSKIRPPDRANSYISCLNGHELGLAFGRESVIHAALAAGGLQRRIVEDAARLASVRNGPAPSGQKKVINSNE
jgi:predicted RNA-binding protein YlxR (DUF448 family)